MFVSSEVIAPRFFAHTIEISMDHVPILKISFVSKRIIVRKMHGAMEKLIVGMEKMNIGVRPVVSVIK
jgi:hypothetical protein